MITALATAITTCDAEPIHIPGSIQPHGLLVVANASTLAVHHVAGDIEGRLGVKQPAGLDLAAVIGTGPARMAATLMQAPDSRPAFIGQVTTPAGEILDASVFRSGAMIGVELEPASPHPESAVAMMGRLETATATLERAISLQALCEQAAKIFREITGFDRVMIYRFGENDAGRVLAEAGRPGIYSFLNHHFPASDIPQQARALYVRNVIRVIPDARYQPAVLRPGWTDPAPFDMSDSNLRSVSPIHVQYLKNMGVRASASISVVRDGVLWGLIACHHETPKVLSYEVRAACRTLAGQFSHQIKAREVAESYRQRIRFRGVEDDVLQLLSREGTLDEALGNHLPQLFKMMDADGVAIMRGSELITGGVHPSEAEIQALGAWLLQRNGDAVLVTPVLHEEYPAAAAFAGVGSGLLSVVLSVEEPWLVMWFRAEQMEVLNWAGNPHKAVTIGPDEALSPRASFDAWQETVRGQSRRWVLSEVDSARRLRIALLDMRQTRRVRELNGQLTRLLQEQTSLVEQKTYLMGEVNHRVQNSLQLVSSFLRLQARTVDTPEMRNVLDEARHRISAVALVHRRLYAGSETHAVDAARYVEELCSDTLASMGNEWVEHVTMDLSPVLIPTDKAVTLGLVLTELFININKYAYAGLPGPIEIRLSGERENFTLEVADKGVGKTSPRPGFGTRMIDGLVSQMGARLVREENHPGLRVILSGPV